MRGCRKLEAAVNDLAEGFRILGRRIRGISAEKDAFLDTRLTKLGMRIVMAN